MKTAIIFFMLSISFLPLAISGRLSLIRLPTSKAGLTGDPVLDIDGNPVVVNAKYYAIPATLGLEGGISASNPNAQNPAACPKNVVLNASIAGSLPHATRRPLVFYPQKLDLSSGDGSAVLESFPLNVAFHLNPSDPCAKENVWKLDVKAEEPVIVTGGVIGDEDDITNWFRIGKNYNGNGYVFFFWPSLCLGCRIRTFGIGIMSDGFQLGINDDFRYPFNFLRAD